ncbi:MAG: hypothetical protein KJ077_25100 [Anaerolineae bacterium]|nr:hypothetical protein [Anaerolineae bacterium]
MRNRNCHLGSLCASPSSPGKDLIILPPDHTDMLADQHPEESVRLFVISCSDASDHPPSPSSRKQPHIPLVADADWNNEIAQEEASGNIVFVFRKRNLTVGEQPTIIRYGYSAQVEDIVLTVTGTSLPAGYRLEGVKLHEVIAAEKANDKCKAAVKAENKRAAAFARLGF